MEKITLYNRTSILIFSILLSGVGGALMLGYNLRKIGKNKSVAPIVIGALIANAVLRPVVGNILPGSAYELFIPNFIVGLVLTFPIWDEYLREVTDFKSKNVWLPLLITIILYGGLYLLNELRFRNQL